MEEKKTNKNGGINYLRLIVSGYLVYLGADLIRDLLCAEATHIALTAVAAAAFTVVGGAVFLREIAAWRRSQHTSEEPELPEETE